VAQDRIRYEEALNKGHSFSWDQRWPEAIAAFEVAAQELPQEPAPHAGLGMVYMELGQYQKALDSYMKAARYSKGDIIHLQPIAELQERLGLSNEAGHTYQAIGEIQLRLKKNDEAMASWLRATSLSTNALLAHQRLAAAYQRQGHTLNAVQEYLAMARILQGQGQHSRAMEVCQTALRLDPRNVEVLTAVEFLQHGQPLPTPTTVAASLPTTGPLMPFEEKSRRSRGQAGTGTPVQEAQRKAQALLAEVVFSDSDDDAAAGNGLGRFERDALISQGLDFQTRGLLDKAIGCYEQAIVGGFEHVAAHFNLGTLLLEQKRLEDAIRAFQIAIKEPTFQLASHLALGQVYQLRGRVEKALEHFITALKLADLSTVSRDRADQVKGLYDALSETLLVKGNPQQAISFMNSLLAFLDDNDWHEKVKKARARLDNLSGGQTKILGDILMAGSHHVLESLHLGQEYARRGFYSTAIEETYRAIQLSPDYLPAHQQLADLLAQQQRREAAVTKYSVIGDTYHVRGDTDGAVFAYEQAAELAPLDLRIRGRLIELLQLQGHVDRSLEHAAAMGETYYQLAQVDKARQTYQEALKLAAQGDPAKKWRTRLLRLIADIDIQRFDWRHALSTYQELHKEDPTDQPTTLALVDLYYKVGHAAAGLRELDRFLIYLVKNGRSSQVESILTELIQQRPTDAGLVERLAGLYRQRKQLDKAIKLLDQLGEAQLNAGETAQAIKTIEKLLTLNPPNHTDYQQLLTELRNQ
jgi:tetratricopeptide (TPR) repeat protein